MEVKFIFSGRTCQSLLHLNHIFFKIKDIISSKIIAQNVEMSIVSFWTTKFQFISQQNYYLTRKEIAFCQQQVPTSSLAKRKKGHRFCEIVRRL